MSQTRAALAYAPAELRERRIADVAAWMQRVVPWVLLAATFAVLLWARMSQPGDLHDDDQSKTMAYTVDMIRHRQYTLPSDVYGQPATKPPMYNWLTIPGIWVFQSWEGWVFKLPSILAAVATCGMIIYGMRTVLTAGSGEQSLASLPVADNVVRDAIPTGAGIVAAAIFLANQPVVNLMYLCRPDMLLTAFLTGAWLSGTIALLRTSGPTRLAGAMFWLCVCGATLTKGPPALAALAYVLIAAPLFARDGFKALRRLHPWLAIPLLVLPLALWIAAGFYQNGWRFYHVYVEQEILPRILGGGPEKGLDAKPWWQMGVWFFARFSPWSLLVMAVVIGLPLRRWRRHLLAPVVVWVVLIMVFFSIPGGKRADYLLPIYPPAAMAAAFLLVVMGSLIGITALRAMLVVGLVVAFVVAYPERRRVTSSDPTEAFARHIRPIVGRDPLVMVQISGYQPLLPLLGRHEGSHPLPLAGVRREKWLEQILAARWAVMPFQEKWPAARAVSNGVAPAGKDGRAVKLALYQLNADGAPKASEIRFMYLKDSRNARTTAEKEAIARRRARRAVSGATQPATTPPSSVRPGSSPASPAPEAAESP